MVNDVTSEKMLSTLLFNACATNLLALWVLIPIKWPLNVCASSQVYLSFRLGLVDSLKYTVYPGSAQPVIAPVLGQCAVTIVPSASSTSAKNRLYLFISVPRMSEDENSMILLNCENKRAE